MSNSKAPLHAVIMAGGSGTRFWPLSRKRLPKQFLSLAGDRSLLRETFERLVPLVGAERVWVVSGEQHMELVRKELPELPGRNILGEPVGRNTAPCIGLAARQILEREPAATMLVCPSDHTVRPPAAFHDAVRAAASFLDRQEEGSDPWTVTFGITPRYASTGFGYIERGEPFPESAEAFRVARFKEKPVQKTAEEYVKSGRFYWNSGIFLWQAKGLLRLVERHLPLLAAGLEEIGRRAAADGLESALKAHFASLKGISIDHGVLEHQKNVAVFAATFDWDDVGSWRAVERYAPRDAAGNSQVGKHVAIDSRGCILVGGKRLIAALGVENLVVVETDDAILVCHREQTERVKEIVDRLSAESRGDLV